MTPNNLFPLPLFNRWVWSLLTLCCTICLTAFLLLYDMHHLVAHVWLLACFLLISGFGVHHLYQLRQDHQLLEVKAKRLETLLKNMPGMAYRCYNQSNWPMMFVSEGCFELCGYERSALEQQQVLWGTFTHPQDVKWVESYVQNAARRGRPFELEYRIITRAGEEKWVWERGRVVERDGDFLVLEGLITDITDRKHTEQALRRAKAYAKAVVDTAVEAVLTIDERGAIETLNQAAQNMFGYHADDIQGCNIRQLINAADLETYNQYITAYKRDLSTRQGNVDCELMGLRQDGTIFPLHLALSHIPRSPERRFVVLIRDLSHQREAERMLREQREQLAHVDRLNTLGEMATAIAHEINQPLTAISMYAQSGIRLLSQEKPEKLRLALEKLTTQTHRAGAVIERVQQMSSQRDSHAVEVDCNRLMRDVHKLAEVEARIRDIVITLHISPSLPKVMADPIQIQQVVLNLLRNGMESMKSIDCAHGDHIELQTAKTAGDGVKISVIDTGSGLSDAVIKQLYQPFSTTKAQGMGMGLSISHSIIRAHGGQLAFQNNAAHGATFYFTLPAMTSV